MDPFLERFEARRKAREEADRSFEILGVTLTVKPAVAPEVGLRVARFQRAISEYVDAFTKAEAEGTPPPDSSGYDDEEMLALSESVIAECLEADSLPAWVELRRPDNPDPLTLLEIYGLATYILSRASALPTDGPSASSDGPPSEPASSTDLSSSPADGPEA